MLTREDKTSGALLLCVYVAFLELTSLGQTSEISPCIVVSQEQSAGNQSSYQACASVHEAVFRLIDFIWSNASHDNIIAFGTVTIALFTLTLWWSTTRLWKAGETHSQRELRAYVFVDGGRIEWSANHGAFRAHVVIKNYGQTPAYDMEIHARAKIFPFNAPDFDFSIKDNTRRSKAPLGPGAHFNVERLAQGRPPDLQHVVDHQKQIFVWGLISYRDAFGKNEALKFRCVNNRIRESDTTWGLEPYPED